MHSQSIGHFVRDTEFAIFWHKKFFPNSKLILLHSDVVVNKYFLQILKREFRTKRFSFNIRLWLRILRFFSPPTVNRILNPSLTRDYSAICHAQTPAIRVESDKSRNFFLRQELEDALGLKIDCPYVVLVVRDSAHDQLYFPKRIQLETYRHSPIDSMLTALNVLQDSGFGIVRMGRDTLDSNTPLNYDYFDYSKRKDLQSDELDFLIFENCRYVISTGSGVDEIGALFRKKICLVNISPPNSPINSLTYPIALSADYYQNNRKLTSRSLLNKTRGRLHPRDIPTELAIQIRPKETVTVAAFLEFFHRVHTLNQSEIQLHSLDFARIHNLELIGNVLY